MDSMEDLLAKVAAAEGPDREIDARIWQAMNPDQQVLFYGGDVRTRRPAEYGRLADFPLEGFDDWEGIAGHVGAPSLTSSVDAALALVERVLPGVRLRMGYEADADPDEGDDGPWFARIDGPRFYSAPTLPLAMLRALLSALITKAAP